MISLGPETPTSLLAPGTLAERSIQGMQCCVRCTHTAVECMPSSCRFLSRSDSVTVSVWNNRKVQRREGAGFLGCVRLSPVNITRLRDTGCELFLCTATAENRRETDCVCVELCWYSSVTATPPPPLLPPLLPLPPPPPCFLRPATEPHQVQP